jgi:glutathione peroxidase
MITRALVLVALLGAAAHAKESHVSILDLTVPTIDGAQQPLSTYRGKVLLIVNVASECGYTPQYTGLEKLWQEYQGRGLVVLGFPSNDFGEQEPGSEAEIKKFCSTKFHVSFPMFAKVKTKGDGQAPIYKLLSEKGEPKWNFHKYLVGKDGKILAAFPSKVAPESAELRQAIDAALR